VIAVSQDLAQRVIQLGADSSRVRVIIDGVNRDEFHPGDKNAARARLGFRTGVRHLLFIGNLVAVKGIDVLIQSCARLPEHLGPWELHLVGDGKLRGDLMQKVARAGLKERVRFHGTQPHASLPDWFRGADLVVLASRSEGIPNVLLEAAACGTPFVATRVGGIPEIAHLGASRLVPPDDPVALSRAVTETLEKPPAVPEAGPRDRREAVADLAKFLAIVSNRFGSERTIPPLEPALPAS
jgi:glycosyltransferase involved in cell wall biosynthesis